MGSLIEEILRYLIYLIGEKKTGVIFSRVKSLVGEKN